MAVDNGIFPGRSESSESLRETCSNGRWTLLGDGSGQIGDDNNYDDLPALTLAVGPTAVDTGGTPVEGGGCVARVPQKRIRAELGHAEWRGKCFDFVDSSAQ
eukprot:scpid92587/ scgid16840/ 